MKLNGDVEERAWIAFAAASLGGCWAAPQDTLPVGGNAVEAVCRSADKLLVEFRNRRKTNNPPRLAN